MTRFWTALAWLMFATAATHACDLRVARKANDYKAVVVGPAPLAEVKRQTEIGTRLAGGSPTARFVNLPRILANYHDEAGAPHTTIAAVTDGVMPAPGASVMLRSRYLDPDDACHYIPWTVVSTPSI